jgi:spore germination protein KC
MKHKIAACPIKPVLCVLMLIILSGCWSAREVNDLEIVVGVGVDKGEVPDGVLLTAQIVKPAEMSNPSKEGESKEGTAFWNARSGGGSIFDAVRSITKVTGNRLFVSHSQILIYGRDLASEGIQRYVDFFLRAHEMRPSAMILISEGTAADVLDVKPEREKLPAMNIVKLVESNIYTAHYKKVNLQEFSMNVMSRTTAPIAPLVRISEEGGRKSVYISGMAVFKNYRLAGTLNDIETRGLLWVLGEVKSGLIDIPFSDEGGSAVLEIMKAKSRVTPEIKDGRLYMHLEIDEEASMVEQSVMEDLLTVPAFEMMQKKQNDVIRREISEAFEKSKKLGADIFGFGELVHEKYPARWKDMESEWDKVYQTINLTFDIKSRILKTELITKPVLPKGADNEH